MAHSILLLAALMASQAHAGQRQDQFRVSLNIVGPSLSVEQHPRLPGSRIIHSTDTTVFQAVEGDVAQVRQQVLQATPGWRWQERGPTEHEWQGMGHSPDGQCIKVLARPVMGEGMVRLDTTGCH